MNPYLDMLLPTIYLLVNANLNSSDLIKVYLNRTIEIPMNILFLEMKSNERDLLSLDLHRQLMNLQIHRRILILSHHLMVNVLECHVVLVVLLVTVIRYCSVKYTKYIFE